MLLSLVAAAALSQAEPAPQQLAWDLRIDGPVTGTLVLGWVLSEFAFKRALAPPACRWCETNGFDTAVRQAFNPTLAPSASGNAAPDMWSNVVGFAVLPLGVLGVDALLSWRDGAFAKAWPVDVLLMLEATFSALAVNQLVKFAVGRGRPFSVGASPELLAQAHDPSDSSLSFFSGHSTFSFALASSAATIASLRGYRHAWLVWVVGLPLAATTAILRLAADKHWMTDVLLGSAFGAAVGVLMPTLLHRRLGPLEARVTPLPNGLAVFGRF